MYQPRVTVGSIPYEEEILCDICREKKATLRHSNIFSCDECLTRV